MFGGDLIVLYGIKLYRTSVPMRGEMLNGGRNCRRDDKEDLKPSKRKRRAPLRSEESA